jgi:hypothetical protein
MKSMSSKIDYTKRPVHPYRLALLTLLALGGAAATRADDGSDPQLTVAVGLKAWLTQWTTWYPAASVTPVTSTNGIRVIEPQNSDTQLALIPQVSARYGDWLASAGYLTNTNYSLSGVVDPTSGNSNPQSGSRQEFDASTGYYFFPSLAVTAGYKRIEQDFGAGYSYVWSGPTLGLTATAALRPHFSLYGSFAYGYLNLKTAEVAGDSLGKTSFHADYTVGEFGLAYASSIGSTHLSYSALLGYRAQIVITRNFALSSGFGTYSCVDVHDVTQGPALSVLVRF